MRKDDVFAYFGNGTKAALALGVTKSAAHQWSELVPERIAYRAQEASGGQLKFDPSLYVKKERRSGADRRVGTSA